MSKCNILKLVLSSTLALVSVLPAWSGDAWPPVSPEETKMTAEPKAPGAPAIFLYRQVDRDDSNGREVNLARIKVLTEEGRKYADVEIPFVKGTSQVRGVKARVIQPDGKVADFDGKIYEKTVVKAKGVKYLAKTFTLPDVRVGTIIDYSYVMDLNAGYVYDSRWIVSQELFTKHAKFSLRKNQDFALQWSYPVGLPEGTKPATKEGEEVVRMETQDVPAFQLEDFMPPENTLKFRVEFKYSTENFESDPEKFWKKWGKRQYSEFDGFINKRKAMEQAVSQIVAANDAPEVKLQKIYDRVLQLRNTTFEREKTEQEAKRAKEKDVNNVEDVFITAAFGLMGYAFMRLALDPAPLMLGFVLGQMLEENLRRALELSRGDFSTFVVHPISGALLSLIGVFVIWQLAAFVRRVRATTPPTRADDARAT